MARLRVIFIRKFIQDGSSGGIILMGSAALALVLANSPLASSYFAALNSYVLSLSVLHWVNDGLMALFFLLVGMEIKRELVIGQLATWRSRALPGAAAIGGMVVPALIYIAFNYSDPLRSRGWAIPASTDIAFSLGVLALLGSRIPISLKVFLTALAILDDLGAVIIIAAFYTYELYPVALGSAALVLGALVVLNASNVRSTWPYVGLGLLLWFLVLRSGVHATIAGVLLAATIPVGSRTGENPGDSPLSRMEHGLQPWVAFAVLPLFGFANAGVSFSGFGYHSLMHPVTLGSALGLFLGKQVGVLVGAAVVVRARWATLPPGVTWLQLYGIGILGGIGFTMSLFIGLLAFADESLQAAMKIGVLFGSLLSAVAGWLLLRATSKPQPRS